MNGQKCILFISYFYTLKHLMPSYSHTHLSHKRSLFPAIYDLYTALKNCCNGPAYDGKCLLEFNGAKSHHIYLSGIDWFSSRQESSGQNLGSFSTCKPNRRTSKSKLSWWENEGENDEAVGGRFIFGNTLSWMTWTSPEIGFCFAQWY